MNYYNEFDPKAAAWLRELIKGGHIPAGVVDERSITEVKPRDLAGFTQCHFFAGIGGWPLALRLAGWPETRPVWSGSCPCQPFSVANSRRKAEDERDLWHVFHGLIEECAPPVVFGEQVASPLGLNWLDSVQADLETSHYAFGAADLCAAGVGAPHIRQRLYWVAIAGSERRARERLYLREWESWKAESEARRGGQAGVGLGNAGGAGSRGNTGAVLGAQKTADGRLWRVPHKLVSSGATFCRACGASIPHRDGEGRCEHCIEWLGDAHGAGSQGRGEQGHGPRERITWPAGVATDWVQTGDKIRPVESGTFPLVDGFPERVGLLRGYGNAIVPQVAAAFITAAVES